MLPMFELRAAPLGIVPTGIPTLHTSGIQPGCARTLIVMTAFWSLS